MSTILYGTPAPIDHDEHAQFNALVAGLLSNPTAKPKSYLHNHLPLVHHAVRTRNIPALNLLAKAGLNLNKSFKEDVRTGENPSNFSTTPLDEALRTDDPAMVTALFQAGLDPEILKAAPDWNKHPYRTILRAGYEPAPCMIDALVDAVTPAAERDIVVGNLVLALADQSIPFQKRPFVASIRHLLARITQSTLRVVVASRALVLATMDNSTNYHPWIHAIVPVLLDAGAIVDGVPGDRYDGLVLSNIAIGMRPSAKREYLVKLLLAQEPKPNVHAKVAYKSLRGTPFLFAVKNNDTVMIDAFLATGALDDEAFMTVKAVIDENKGDWAAQCEKALNHVRPAIVAAERKYLGKIAEAAMAEGGAPEGGAARVRARL